MTYKVWERQFKSKLKSLPSGERKRIVEYYREMFADLTSGERSEESVLAEFGTPEQCAAKVLNDGEAPDVQGDEAVSAKKERPKFSAAEILGLAFFTLLLLLPLLAVAISVLIALGALCISGGAVGIAGLVFACYFPFSGVASSAVAAGVGLGLGASGVGLFFLVGFFYATKGAAIALVKALKAIYVRR